MFRATAACVYSAWLLRASSRSVRSARRCAGRSALTARADDVSAPRQASCRLKQTGVVTKPPKLVQALAPDYPPAALAAGKQAKVRVRIHIDATGVVTAVDAASTTSAMASTKPRSLPRCSTSSSRPRSMAKPGGDHGRDHDPLRDRAARGTRVAAAPPPAAGRREAVHGGQGPPEPRRRRLTAPITLLASDGGRARHAPQARRRDRLDRRASRAIITRVAIRMRSPPTRSARSTSLAHGIPRPAHTRSSLVD